jgi:uncharacterized protein YjbI with pentapeptide repeats
MKNIDTFVQHIREKIELYVGYRIDSDQVEEWAEEPIYVFPARTGKDLSGENFSGKDLESVQLDGFDLRGANFSEADLTQTNFTGANLEGAIFTGALLVYTDFTDANLSNCKGLETCFDLRNYSCADQEFATAKFKGSNLTGVSDRFFEILLEIERTTDVPPWGLKTWKFGEHVTRQEVSIEEFLEGCILPKNLAAMLNRKKKTKNLFGV